MGEVAAIPAPQLNARDTAMYKTIARKMYHKMPVPAGIVRVPFERLDADATKLWMLLAQAAVEALNETEI